MTSSKRDLPAHRRGELDSDSVDRRLVWAIGAQRRLKDHRARRVWINAGGVGARDRRFAHLKRSRD
jgi:hypothetical protein